MIVDIQCDMNDIFIEDISIETAKTITESEMMKVREKILKKLKELKKNQEVKKAIRPRCTCVLLKNQQLALF